MYELKYIAVFFEGQAHIGRKTISLNQFQNITDKAEAKVLIIEGKNYNLLSFKTFSIVNSIDNNVFLICEVKSV